MRIFGKISSLALFSALSFANPINDVDLDARAVPASAAATLPFNINYAFTARLTLGPPPASALRNPIPLAGGSGTANGILLPSPILTGTVTGPALNATITSGFAIPAVYNTTAGTIQIPATNAYGVTDDGVELYIVQSGVGPQLGQTTRIQMSIGGGAKYARLRDGFILTALTPDADHIHITVTAYLIENSQA
ncbi:hypothetical protein H2200_008471 [Cladophialophora chaetospira]|uniref:Dirigent protein n=1 Tax=Cladophialophora chaetospira TaxID=386627 RepID=A0AA38X5U4_9EURO|nr:hypothetical protein H2200_008471 [Cladophialophora chaetospira]